MKRAAWMLCALALLAGPLTAAEQTVTFESGTEEASGFLVTPDGDPLTRSPQDPSARLDGVKLGAAGLRLRLR